MFCLCVIINVAFLRLVLFLSCDCLAEGIYFYFCDCCFVIKEIDLLWLYK